MQRLGGKIVMQEAQGKVDEGITNSSSHSTGTADVINPGLI
jgi:hypothetical protein